MVSEILMTTVSLRVANSDFNRRADDTFSNEFYYLFLFSLFQCIGEENSTDARISDPGGTKLFSPWLWTTGPILYLPQRVCQSAHMCLKDWEKAFDHVPRGILWEVLWEFGVESPLLRAVWSVCDRSRSLVCIANSN